MAAQPEETKRFEKSPERVALESYFETQPSGAKLAWRDIEEATGVYLGPRENGLANRQMARAAAISAGHKGGYVAVPGWGIELACPENVDEIARRRSRRFRGQLKRSVRECDGALAMDLDPMQRQAIQWRHTAHKIALQSMNNDLGALPAAPSSGQQMPILPKAK